MTYSGLLMLVACAAGRARDVRPASPDVGGTRPAGAVPRARLHAHAQRVGWRVRGHRPALRAARFPAARPAAGRPGVFLMVAPPKSHDAAVLDVQPVGSSNVDRVAMMRSGLRIIKDDPLTGVGPDMIIQVYPHYRDKSAVNQLNPHLHNVPLQIAAERGLPALAVWLWFIVSLIRDFLKRRKGEYPIAVKRRPRRDCGDARGRAVRIQFRRLRVPDAVPRADHAAVRGRPSRGDRPPPPMPACRLSCARCWVLARPHGLDRRRPDARSFRDRRGRAHLARSAGARRSIRSRR